MTTPASSADAAPAITGQVILRPGAGSTIDAASVATHAMGEVIKTLIRHSLGFPDESLILRGIDAVDAFVKHTAKEAHSRLVSENDIAPVEDVRVRRAPNAPTPAAAGMAPIDYDKLAEALAPLIRQGLAGPDSGSDAAGDQQ